MSGGGPPHHPHNRHVPPANSAWNHLSVPGYFPRQPQVAHMQAEHPMLHPTSWHTPTTPDAMKLMPHTQMLNEMFTKNEPLFTRKLTSDCVDLSLTRNGNQNGELPSTAISLSVRDTSKINSLPPSMLDIQAMELTKCASPNLKSAVSPGSIRTTSMSPGLKAASPGLLGPGPALKSLSPGRKSLSPGPKSCSPGLLLGNSMVLPTASATISSSEVGKNQKRSNIRVDSILERLNPTPEKTFPYQQDIKADQSSTTITAVEKSQIEKPPSQSQSVIVSAASNYDENSNSSGTTNVPTPKEEDSASMNSNEDSLDSTKSRRKRKPSKTIRVNKDDEIKTEKDQIFSESTPPDLQTTNHKKEPTDLTSHATDPAAIATILEGAVTKLPERLEEAATDESDDVVPAKTRRKASSESETIDNIAAMVQEGLKDKGRRSAIVEGSGDEEKKVEETVVKTNPPVLTSAKPVTVSVIKTKEHLEETLSSGTDTPPEVSAVMESAPLPVLPPVPPLITPAQKKASAPHFVEDKILQVENKLEEMFAGIVEEDHAELTPSGVALEPLKNDSTLGLTDDSFIKLDDSDTSPKEAVTSSQEAKSPEEPASPPSDVKKDEKDEAKPLVGKKPRRSRPPSKRESDQEGEVPSKKKRLIKSKSFSSPPKKPPRSPAGVGAKSPKKPPLAIASNKTPTKTTNSEAVKDIFAYDSGSNASSSKSRGPFVQIRGPRDSPLSVNVVNTPLTGDEDGEKKTIKNKKFHDDSEYRHKVRSKGLHCSTLSNKYDAERKDATWICAFCKRGPHASELTGPSVLSEVQPQGDLFGPYFITTQCPEFEKRLDDPYDRQFKSRKIVKVLDAASAATSAKSNKKTKRKSESSVDPTDIYLGITDTGNNTYEVWVHEDCMVWSQGVYLVGPKIAGLEEAVWTCSNLPCSSCGLRGANITCVKRGCIVASHVCCARKSHWQLDEADFKAYCPEHSRQ